jgi:hypothetical protein
MSSRKAIRRKFIPAGDVTTGVVRDYLRLELNDGSKAYPVPPDNQRPDYPTLP